ncbi:MAG TPA: protoheme IX farnesyltransferase [Ignavibacteria bacterium]|nr:protoheme IX farnesyltransferase [Ignavibacteria bacterium]
MKLINSNIAVVNSSTGLLTVLFDAIKIKITLFVAFSTFLGYILASGSFSFDFIYPVLGIFILACGSAALNQYQERDYDALMKRTMNRPIPSGTMKPSSVLAISLALILTGSVILIVKTNLLTLIVGLLTLAAYNYMYTPLKRKSEFAIIPGSLVGALPPLAGWVAAGGEVLNGNILLIVAYFFVWQIPHFWLLLLIYNNDYKRAGFPVLTDKYDTNKLKKLIIAGVVATTAFPIVLCFTGILNYDLSAVFIIMAGIITSALFVKFYNSESSNKTYLKYFILINLYNLLIISVFSLDKLISFI